MARRAAGRATSSRVVARSASTNRVARSALTGRFVSAPPVRSKAASARLTATLKSLGADPTVVEAAGRD